jgi:hypothetical protein
MRGEIVELASWGEVLAVASERHTGHSLQSLLLPAAGLADDVYVLASKCRNRRKVAAGDYLWVNQRCADPEGASTGFQEVGGCFQIHAAGGHQADVWQRAVNGPDISGPCKIGWKNFHNVGPRLPSCQDFRGGSRHRGERACYSGGKV